MKTYLLIAVLLVNVKLFSQCYSVSAIPYLHDTSISHQTTVQLADDQWSAAIPIGFTFCFYGEQYDSLLIGTNGILTFDLDTANEYCQWVIGMYPVPSVNFPVNSIMVPWADLNPFKMGAIYFYTGGAAPNRTFTVIYDSMPMYQGPLGYGSRAILHEGSNEIEIQLDSKPYCGGWNFNRAIIGVQNQFGTAGVAAPGRSTPVSWNAVQEGWLFTPDCDVCSGVGMNDLNADSAAVSVFPNPSQGTSTISLSGLHPAIAKFEVVDLSGRTIQAAQVAISGGQQFQVSVNEPGLYFVRLYDQNNELISSHKLIKVRE